MKRFFLFSYFLGLGAVAIIAYMRGILCFSEVIIVLYCPSLLAHSVSDLALEKIWIVVFFSWITFGY